MANRRLLLAFPSAFARRVARARTTGNAAVSSPCIRNNEATKLTGRAKKQTLSPESTHACMEWSDDLGVDFPSSRMSPNAVNPPGQPRPTHVDEPIKAKNFVYALLGEAWPSSRMRPAPGAALTDISESTKMEPPLRRNTPRGWRLKSATATATAIHGSNSRQTVTDKKAVPTTEITPEPPRIEPQASQLQSPPGSPRGIYGWFIGSSNPGRASGGPSSRGSALSTSTASRPAGHQLTLPSNSAAGAPSRSPRPRRLPTNVF